MKLSACLTASLLALLGLAGSVRADSPGDSDNPYADVDADGVPLA